VSLYQKTPESPRQPRRGAGEFRLGGEGDLGPRSTQRGHWPGMGRLQRKRHPHRPGRRLQDLHRQRAGPRRRNKSVIIVKAAQILFKNLYAARADNSLDKELISLISPSLLVINDFGLERLSPEQAYDFYEIVAERYERNSLSLQAIGTSPSGSNSSTTLFLQTRLWTG